MPPPRDTGYPCYGACFSLHSGTPVMVSAGGGGAGKVGLANRLTVFCGKPGADGNVEELYHKDIVPRKLKNGVDTVGEEALRVATPTHPAPPYHMAVALTTPARCDTALTVDATSFWSRFSHCEASTRRSIATAAATCDIHDCEV